MFKNYLKIAWRKIIRDKTYSVINIAGLSLGLCACIVLYVIISYELSFDTFHPGKERIYRVMGDVTESTGNKLHFARIPPSVSLAGRSSVPGLEAIASIIPYNAKISIPQRAKHFESRTGETHYPTTVIAEPQYFDIFKYKWLAGNDGTALASPLTVVLTESRAREYFGAGPLDEMVGKQVIYQDSLRVSVSGIVQDWNKNSDLSFTDFISFSTLRTSFLKNDFSTDSWKQGDMTAWVFTKLRKSTTPAPVKAQLSALVKMHADQQTKLALWLEPLSNIHFNADVIENPIRTAHMPTLYSLMAIALFILMLAIINFINLSTAQSIQRAKEVGVRKVLGSSRWGLTLQFLTETLLLTLISVSLAVAFVKPVLAAFRSFIPTGVSFHFFDPLTIIFLMLLIIIVSVLAGLYPAKVLSSYMPVQSLKGAGTQRGGEAWLLRKSLIVFQFSVSLVFIISSMVIASQLRYTREKYPGFATDAIVTAETPRGEGFAKVARVAQKIRQIPGVNQVALQWVSPMTDNARGMKLKFKSTDQKDFWVTQVAGNEDFIPLYKIKLLAGRNLLKSDSVNEFVINESLSRVMGHKKPAESLGAILYWNDKPYPVVGVVADFHTSSLHDPITPLCIINRPDRESALAIRLASIGKQSATIQHTFSQIEKVWKQVYPATPFNYRFYDESLALLYEKDRQTATLMNTSMAITIFISCIGLFGLALFTAKKRAKEISIRKILGASNINIINMLSRDSVELVIIALFIASPIAWYFMNKWLQGFTYRVHISGWVFILAGMTAILIALLTVSAQAVKAAIVNPVKNLRSE
jgi:ABC-type antimicrobial peptide transport system permease subunit